MQQFQVGLRDPPGAGAEQAGLQLGAALRPSTVRGHQLAPTCTPHTALRVSTFAALLFVLQEEEENPQPGGDAPGEAAWPWCEQSWRGQVQGVLVVCVAGK